MDKSKWGEGPWQEEADVSRFRRKGLECVVSRHPEYGHLCGYVLLPEGHPAFGKGDEEIDVSVHGGITWAGEALPPAENGSRPGEFGPVDRKIWVVGFDCSHAGDLAPGLMLWAPKVTLLLGYPDTYRTMEYAVEETKGLADQLAARQEVQGER